jgi:uncharacterized membrane protein
MSFYDWLLFLHVASGFALVGSLVVYWFIAVVGRNVDRPSESLRFFRIAQPANVLAIVGTLGTIIFGIWLAIDSDAFQVWDGWVLAALALWVFGTAAAARGGQAYTAAQKLAVRLAGEGRGDEPSSELRVLLQDRRAMWLNILSTAAILLILVLMIYKPGA